MKRRGTAARRRSIGALRRAVSEIPSDQLLKLACEMVVTCLARNWHYDEADEQNSNPLIQLAAREYVPPAFLIRHQDVARLLLAKIRDREETGRAALERDYSISQDQEFQRLDELIGAFVQVPEILYQIPEKLLTVYEIDEAINIFFVHGPSQVLADACHDAYSALWLGVPLYSLRQAPFGLPGSSVREIDVVECPPDDPEYLYLAAKARYFDTSRDVDCIGNLPGWSDSWYLKTAHLECCEKHFGPPQDWGKSLLQRRIDVDVNSRRAALRKELGLSPAHERQTAGSGNKEQWRGDRKLPTKSMNLTEFGKRGADARWSKQTTARKRAAEIFLSKQWVSRAEAVRQMLPEIMRIAAESGVPLAPTNAIKTVEGWLKRIDRSP